jgi:uncharacterized protein
MRRRTLLYLLAAGLLAVINGAALAQADLRVDTPAIQAIRASMRNYFGQLRPYFESGAVGPTWEGNLAVRDANLIPLAERQNVNRMIAADNEDRAALYREIARANGHPEWEADIRSTFAQRWIERAHPGWWYQTKTGAWVQKQ